MSAGDISNLAKEVSDLCKDVKEVQATVSKVREDVAFIKGKMEGGNIQSSNSTKLKASMIGSLIMGLSGIIVAVISFFKS